MRVVHLTANPALPRSTFAYLGRNDVPIALAAQIARSATSADEYAAHFSTLLIGSGVFEPLYCLRSQHLPSTAKVYAVDADEQVVSHLRSLRSGLSSVPHQASRSTNAVDALKGRSAMTPFPSENEVLLLRSSERRRLFVERCDIKKERPFSTVRQRFSLIVCNNLLPNLLMIHPVDAFQSLVRCLAERLAPGGCLLIGTIDSSLYPSGQHPRAIGNYSRRCRSLFEGIPLRLSLWCTRAIVSERLGSARAVDGYSFLFFTHGDPNACAILRARLNAGSVKSCVRPSSTSRRMVGRIWKVSRAHYIWLALPEQSGVVGIFGERFPKSSIAALHGREEFHPRVMEWALRALNH